MSENELLSRFKTACQQWPIPVDEGRVNAALLAHLSAIGAHQTKVYRFAARDARGALSARAARPGLDARGARDARAARAARAAIAARAARAALAARTAWVLRWWRWD